MKLYLVQHGNSNPKDVDPKKGLSEKGLADVKKMAEFLKPLALSVGEVWHSGKARAAQTADLLLPAITATRGATKQEGLAPNDPVAPIVSKINGLSEDMMIVGHLPFLGKFASALLDTAEPVDVIVFQQGGVVSLERSESRAWSVRWMVIPDLLP